MIPLRDEERLKGNAPVTKALIGVNVVAFVLFSERLVYELSFVPRDIFTGGAMGLLTSQFVHGDFIHLIFNMWPLWIFGDNIELRMGRIKFLVFYLSCGIVAGVIHSLFTWFSVTPVIGASGAVAGVIGAYMVLYPKNYITTFVPGLYEPFIHIPAYYWAIFWLAIQLFYGFFSFFSEAEIAYWAHVGGFLFGYLAAKLFRKLGGKASDTR